MHITQISSNSYSSNIYNNNKKISFKKIELSKPDFLLAKKLASNNSDSKNMLALYEIFREPIEKEAKLKVKINHSFEDFLQNMYLRFFELLKELNAPNAFEFIMAA